MIEWQIGACLDFTLADLRHGHATFTLVRAEDGERFTYKFRWQEILRHGIPTGERVMWAWLLCGRDNTSDYKRVAVYHPETGELERTAASAIRATAPGARMLDGFLGALRAAPDGVTPPGWQVYLSTECLRCGRPLTVPSSVAAKYGPDCAEMAMQF